MYIFAYLSMYTFAQIVPLYTCAYYHGHSKTSIGAVRLTVQFCMLINKVTYCSSNDKYLIYFKIKPGLLSIFDRSLFQSYCINKWSFF